MFTVGWSRLKAGLGLLLCLGLCAACASNPKAGSAPAAAAATATASASARASASASASASAAEDRSASPLQSDGTTPAPTAEPGAPSAVEAGEAPLRPEAAVGLTVPAAEGFVRYFFETLNYLKTTGDDSATTQAADPGCKPCNAMLTTYRKANGANDAVTGDYAWRDVTVSSAKLLDPSTAEVTMTARQGAYSIKPAPTAPIETAAPTEFSLRLTLSAQGQHWMMFDFKRENPQ
ncbi:hypothetical protein GCM10009789_08840 [Kribbella sancticallisti]|uniref:DUF6318 domain-containing protein n=1 Tax=Kribbella sancticallisti TaxID=460087 RepID=A0ABP4NBP6_9ACTN